MRRAAVVVVLVGTALVGVPLAVAAPAPEARQDEIAEEIARLEDSIDEVAADEVELLAALEASRARTAELDRRIAGLDAEITASAAELVVAEAELEAAEAHHVAVIDDLRRTRAELAEATGILREQAITAFVRGGEDPGAMSFVLQASDVTDVQSGQALSRVVVDQQDAVVRRTEALERRTVRLEAEAERAAGDAADRRRSVADDKEALEGARAEQATARAEAAAEAAVEAELLAGAKAERARYEARVGSLEAESSAIEEQLRQRAEEQRQAALRDAAAAQRSSGGAAVLSRGSGALSWPLANPVVTSNFGYRTHPIFGGRRLHAGIDFRAPTGTPIRAAADGVVVSAGWRGGYGNAVIIDHGGSMATLSGHLSEISVSAGQSVTRGQVVGAAGSTGGSTGPHLHLEVRIDGAPVDPWPHF